MKKRTHFIPKTYLEKFFNNDNVLYVYKKGQQFFKEGVITQEMIEEARSL